MTQHGGLGGGAAVPADVEAPQTVGVMRQPFMPVIDRGEYALMYFGGRFSHAALRFPPVFRKDRASYPCPQPPAHVLALAERVMASLLETTAYARVDIVDTADGPLLMELELCEPHLFFRCIENPADRDETLAAFAKALAS